MNYKYIYYAPATNSLHISYIAPLKGVKEYNLTITIRELCVWTSPQSYYYIGEL